MSRPAAIALGLLAPWLLLVGNAPAQEGGLAAHDGSLPIEISSDSLTVRQRDQFAVFEGNVQAAQGDLTLRSELLRVFYDLRDQPAGSSSQAIQRLEAEGDVVIASARETATGDRGRYDLAGGTLVLEGDVTLTQDDNVIRGSRLVVDLNAETATMTAGTADGAADGDDGRVRALFVPGEDAGES